MKCKNLILSAGMMIMAMAIARSALADAAPPEPPPGASINSDEPSTYVQMISESVVMAITDYNGPSVFGDWCPGCDDLVSNQMVGHVQAYFEMRNQGTATETLDVRFPLGYFSDEPIQNFTAYVDGQTVEHTVIEDKETWSADGASSSSDVLSPWATWKVVFPPGQTVNLGVEYDVHPAGWALVGTFTYILETGAGWYGPIGEGTITFRLPYDVNEMNTVFYPGTSPHPDYYTFSGPDVTWHFSDLEPAEEDNVHLTVLLPSLWRTIDEAQTRAEANPGSVDAQLELADALMSAVNCSKGCGYDSLVQAAEQAYQRALELDPGNVDIYSGYLGLLLNIPIPGEPVPEQFVPLLESALELDPDNERLLELQDFYYGYLDWVATTIPDATWLPTRGPNRVTATPTLTQTPGSPGKPFMTWTPGPTRTSYFHPTSTPTTFASPTPIPTPSTNTTSPITLWATVGAAMIGGAGVGVWVYRKRRVS
ncbi:MAG: hypothetical protein JXB07_05270 [Anaerolineae bacterium]|nr:hypothetical protein [Anaerolineae bacterium]